MVLENGYPYPGQALPTPTDTPYQTPSRGFSGRSSRQNSSSPFPDYSPTPFPPSDDSYFANQHTTIDSGDERYSARDPRRLTQNLDMSLVAQIHSLKKELESKDNLVHTLEDSLHQSKAETERLTADVTTQKAEVRSVKSQMQSLEHDMLKEFEKTVRERDDAMESVADTRKRLEESKKKVRAQEEDANRTHEIWERDRQDLEDKNRRLEGKNNVLEQHLKTMAAAMAAQSTPQGQISGTEDNFGPRTSSRQSNRSLDDIYEDKPAINFRDSRMTSLRRPGSSQMGSLSLAEELELGDEEDENEDEDDGAMKFSHALPEEEQPSRRYSEDEKAKKVMGFHADGSEQRVRDRSSSQASMKSVDSHLKLLRKQSVVAYTDTAIQCSPLPSSTSQNRQLEYASEKTFEQTEHAANQSRKRVSIPQIFVDQNPTTRSEVSKPKATKPSRMVSTACQTVEEPGSPLSSPKPTNGLPNFIPAKETRTWSTQTSDDVLPAFASAGPRISLSPLDVPVIAIHPPSSRPPSSHNSVVLPPRTKNAGCQVAIEMPTNMRSTAMQTDQIQVERRPARLPLRLQLSSPSSQPPSQSTERRIQASKAPPTSAPESSKRVVPIVPPKSSKRSIPSPSMEVNEGWGNPSSPLIEDAYPGNNDNGPLNGKDPFGPRRPIRSDSIFAGFDASDDGNDKVPSDYSDDDFGNAAPIRKTLSKVQNSWKLVPQSDDSVFDRVISASEEHGDQSSRQPSKELSRMPIPKSKAFSQTSSKTFPMRHTEAPRKPQSTTKEPDMRRKAAVINGITAHTQRSRSPSLPNASGKETTMAAPPFPVPTRSSSRRIPVSASDGAVSPSPYTTSFFTTRRGQDPGKAPNKRKLLRKTQSAAAVSKPTGPPPPHPPLPKSASSSMPGRPKSPHNQFVLPYDHVTELPSQLSKASRPPSHAGQASIEAPSQQTSVVDAIAQTMVGEWMWKYVRKRTSFGITETPQAEFELGRNGETGNSSGVRHKRWVWLAPYENAVIWSSKQPTSGPALLGKGGRKRMSAKCPLLLTNADPVTSYHPICAGCQRRYTFAQECWYPVSF